MSDFEEPLWREAWRQSGKSNWTTYSIGFYQIAIGFMLPFCLTLFKSGCIKKCYDRPDGVSTKIYLAFIICGLLHITSGISGVVAIFLEVEGPAEENKLQGLFQSFMILTIICSTISMWPIFFTFYYCVFLRFCASKQPNCEEKCEDHSSKRKGSLWRRIWPFFIVWGIIGFVAVGWAWEFAWGSDFELKPEEP